MIELIKRLAPTEGYTSSLWNSVTSLRFQSLDPKRLRQLYEDRYVIVRRVKRAVLRGEMFVLRPQGTNPRLIGAVAFQYADRSQRRRANARPGSAHERRSPQKAGQWVSTETRTNAREQSATLKRHRQSTPTGRHCSCRLRGSTQLRHSGEPLTGTLDRSRNHLQGLTSGNKRAGCGAALLQGRSTFGRIAKVLLRHIHGEFSATTWMSALCSGKGAHERAGFHNAFSRRRHSRHHLFNI